ASPVVQQPPSGMSVLLTLCGTAMLSIMVALLVAIRTRRRRPSRSAVSSKVGDSLAAIPEDQVLPSTRESLTSLSANPPVAGDAGQGSS
ncbi:MAG: hypothetical protein QGH11_08810, partial [Pirellulaceae bacterium]|nr:hypothetical protein [Pirellulaceae bacterium]